MAWVDRLSGAIRMDPWSAHGIPSLMDAGLVPVKRLSLAKARLQDHFSRADCTRIARALFEDVMELCAAAGFISWWIVSDDAKVIEAASARGLNVVADRGAGLNSALVDAIDAVSRAGARSVTIVPSDIPLAARSDLIDLLDTGATSDLVVVPSRSDGGTNALYMSPPGLIEPQFGPGSLAAHIADAENRKLRCSVLPLERVELDIDTIEDVQTFLHRASEEVALGGRTAVLLRDLVDASDFG